MSVVILGGNECMERRYRELCESYQCQSKIFTKPAGGLRNKLGSPDLTIFFTNTMSHKMVQGALSFSTCVSRWLPASSTTPLVLVRLKKTSLASRPRCVRAS